MKKIKLRGKIFQLEFILVTALAVELGSFIERSIGVRPQNSEFLGETEVAQFCSGLIWSSFGRDAPFDAGVYLRILGLPDSLQ